MNHARLLRCTPGFCGGLVLVGLLWCCASAVAGSGEAAVRVKVVARNSSSPVFTHTLRKGQSGADIKTLQKWLSDVGYSVPENGYFGTATKSAVHSFQLAHRLYPATGYVGDRTAAALLIAVTKLPKPKPAPKPKAIDPASSNRTGSDPIPGFTIERDDMGVDASAQAGAGIYAPVASVLVQVLQDWYAGEPLLLFQFVKEPARARSDYWYVAEQINPVTTSIGTQVAPGRRVASFASWGTGIEIGWGSPTSNARTLADVTDPGAASPPAGSTTIWGESFKKFFGIP